MINQNINFMICENPVELPNRLFIFHISEPQFLAEVFHLDIKQEKEWLKIKSKFNTGASVDSINELIFIGTNITYNNSSQETADKYAKIMSQMGDWYSNYIEWEDNNLSNL